MEKQYSLGSRQCKDIKYTKAKAFALRIINMCKFLRSNGTDYVMLKQVMRSGTSIGANIAEAQYAESIVDFIHKLNIAQKECNETRYWIELLFESDEINEDMYNSLYDDCTEILKLLTSVIVKNKKRKQSNL